MFDETESPSGVQKVEAVERKNLNLSLKESVIMLSELNDSLTPIIAKARLDGDDRKLDFYERNIKTRVSEKLYSLLQPDDKRVPERIPYLRDKKEGKEFNSAWKGIKADYSAGKYASQGEFEDAMEGLYKNFWEKKEILENFMK